MHLGQGFNVPLFLAGTAFCRSINTYTQESPCLGSNPDSPIYNKYDFEI